MRGTLTTFSCLTMLALSAPALAQSGQQSAVKIGQYNAWGTYSYQDEKFGKVCYALTVPTERKPANLDHGDIYFFVSQKPGQNISYEPQFIASYNFQEASKVKVTVGNKSYSMMIRDKSAWMENAAEEPQLIAAMKAGADMTISAKSARGNDTSYDFSLLGVSAAMEAIANCK